MRDQTRTVAPPRSIIAADDWAVARQILRDFQNSGLSLAKRKSDLRVIRQMVAANSVSVLLQPIPRCSLHL